MSDYQKFDFNTIASGDSEELRPNSQSTGSSEESSSNSQTSGDSTKDLNHNSQASIDVENEDNNDKVGMDNFDFSLEASVDKTYNDQGGNEGADRAEGEPDGDFDFNEVSQENNEMGYPVAQQLDEQGVDKPPFLSVAQEVDNEGRTGVSPNVREQLLMAQDRYHSGNIEQRGPEYGEYISQIPDIDDQTEYTEEEKSEAMRKIKFLKNEIDKTIKEFTIKKNKNRGPAFLFQILATALAATVTILLGIKVSSEYVNKLNNIALIISALMTLVSAVTNFFDYKILWSTLAKSLKKLEILKQNISFYEEGNQHIRLREVNIFRNYYSKIIEETAKSVSDARGDFNNQKV